MKKFLFLLAATLMMAVSTRAEVVTTGTWPSSSLMTYTQLLDMSGKSGHVAFTAVSGDAPTNHKWFNFLGGNVSAANQADLTKATLFTISGTTDAYHIQRVSDGNYLAGANSFGATAMDLKLVNRAGNDHAPEYDLSVSVSIDNASNGHYNANSCQFASGTGGYSAYAAYGPFYVVSVEYTINSEVVATKDFIATAGQATINEAPSTKYLVKTPANVDVTADCKATVEVQLNPDYVQTFPEEGTYYVTLTNKDTNNHPYIYNALSESTYTLQSATSGSTNNFIWKVVSDGAGNFTSIVNGDGRGVGVNGQYKGRVTSLQYKDKGNGYYYLYSSVIKAAKNDHECLNRSANPTDYGSNGIRTVTTWKGEDKDDNLWKVETVEAASVYTVEITGAENAYVTIGSEYAYDGGFFLAETIAEENVQASEVAGHKATVTIEGKTIKVVYTQSAQERTITFHLGAPVNTDKEVKLYDGETPTADAIGITLPAGVTATPEPAFATVSGDATYTITFTDNNTYPFQTGKFYNLAFNRNATKPVHIYVNGTAIDTRDTDHSYVEPTYSTQDYYKWSIDGDWYHGFAWKNKGANKYVSYGSANPSDKYTATLVDAADDGSYFDYISNGGYNYFKLHGTTNNAFISNNGGAGTTFLTNWNAAGNIGDAGAQIIITEATDIPEPATVTYTVTSITGAEGKVIYDEHEYGVNDSFVAGNDLQSSNLSATPVEGYEYTITIDGSYNITLEYVSSSPIVARMADFVSAGTNNGATDITANYNVVEGGAVYSFEDNGYIGAISNPALAKLLNDGNKVITVAAWVYGNPTGGTFFGYGGQQNGVMLKDNSGSLQATWKGADDVQAQDGALADDQWNLVAYSFKSGVGCRYIISSGFYTRGNSAKMVTPPSVEQLFAVGSGNQEKARDCFNGILANLTIIKSDGQLNDSQVKEYIGAAPTAKATSYTLSISEYGVSTICLPENAIVPEGVTVYISDGINERGNLNMVELDDDVMPAYAGYVVEGDAGDYVFNYTDQNYTGNFSDEFYTLMGETEDTPVSDYEILGTPYVLSVVDGQLGFYKYAGEIFKANRAFYLNTGPAINGFSLDFGGQTVGINSVISATNLKAGYDIQGRRINKIQKGINILNGKKIIK